MASRTVSAQLEGHREALRAQRRRAAQECPGEGRRGAVGCQRQERRKEVCAEIRTSAVSRGCPQRRWEGWAFPGRLCSVGSRKTDQ